MHKKAIVGLMGVLVLTGAVLGNGIAFADDSVDSGSTTDDTTNTVSSSASANASVTVSAACSFERTSGSGEYTGILANNSSATITGSTFAASCNDAGGYDIYAVGYSNDTFGVTDLIFNNTIDSPYNIKTDGTGSNWGMSLTAATTDKPVIVSGFGNSENPHVIPSTYTKIASYNGVTLGDSDNIVPQNITVSYTANASSTQPAGTYTGAVKYTMVHPVAVNVPYFVVFNPNGGSIPSDGSATSVATTMNDQAIFADEQTTLATNEYTRTGYTFAGWNTKADGTGTSYTDGAEVVNLTTAGGEVVLYATWTENT